MKILVAIKQVPERDALVHFDATGKWIDEVNLQWALNESDAYALEEALQLKEKHGGEVVVVSAGPERVGSTIREALAKGGRQIAHGRKIETALGIKRVIKLGAAIGGLAYFRHTGPQIAARFSEQITLQSRRSQVPGRIVCIRLGKVLYLARHENSTRVFHHSMRKMRGSAGDEWSTHFHARNECGIVFQS